VTTPVSSLPFNASIHVFKHVPYKIRMRRGVLAIGRGSWAAVYFHRTGLSILQQTVPAAGVFKHRLTAGVEQEQGDHDRGCLSFSKTRSPADVPITLRRTVRATPKKGKTAG